MLKASRYEYLSNLSASLLFIFSSLPSSAVLATSIWQGPYMGAYMGGGFGNNHLSTNSGTVTSTSYFTSTADLNAVNDAASSTNDPASAIIGIQVGHDWVWRQMVYGIIVDYGSMSLSSSNKNFNIVYPDSSNEYSVSTSIRTNWLFTLRGRLGYQTMLTWPSLFYLTGGMAITQLKINNYFSDNSSYVGTGGNNNSENQIGWIAGVGIELASFDHGSFAIEYSYLHVPSVKTTSSIFNSEAGFGIPAQSLISPFITSGQFRANLLKIVLNYRLDE